MGASYVGLATGAGGAGGLETLLARMRADEVMAQHQQQLAQQKDFQTRSLGQTDRSLNMQSATNDRLNKSADIDNQAKQVRIDTLRRITSGMDDSGQGAGDNLTRPPAGADASVVPQPKPDTSMSRFNNPLGRAQIEIAGLQPNSMFGSIPQPKGPEDLSAEESFYTGLAKRAGQPDYKTWAAADPGAFVKAKHQWAEESRIISPAQASEPLVQTDDPDNPGNSIWTPRSQAKGMRATLPAGQKDRLKAYTTTLELIDAIEKQGDEIGWKGLGPIRGRIGRIGMEYAGVGDPREEELRNKIDTLKAQASFQEGGKQFTGTEKALLDAFLTGVNQNPTAARTRLKSFKEQAQRSMQSLNGTNPTPGPGAADGGDLYSQYLARTKGGSK